MHRIPWILTFPMVVSEIWANQPRNPYIAGYPRKYRERFSKKMIVWPVTYCRASCQEVSAIVKKIAVAMENGEYDFDGTQDKVVRNCVIKEIRYICGHSLCGTICIGRACLDLNPLCCYQYLQVVAKNAWFRRIMTHILQFTRTMRLQLTLFDKIHVSRGAKLKKVHY